MKKFRILQLLLIITAAFPVNANSGDTAIIIRDDINEYQVGHNLYILEDKKGSLTFDEISGGLKDGDFEKSKWAAPNPGFLDSILWVKFSVKNPFDETRRLYLEHKFPPMDSIDLYFKGEGKFDTKRGGDSVSYEARDILYRNTIFSIECGPAERKRFLSAFQIIQLNEPRHVSMGT